MVTNPFAQVVVKRSYIHGNGVFATRSFKKGEVVVRWQNTQEISAQKYEALSFEQKKYVEFQDGKIFLLGAPERHVNHSCDPNTVPGIFCDIACKDIAAGDEITVDYSYFYIPTGQFQCNCGLKSCRKTIRGIALINTSLASL